MLTKKEKPCAQCGKNTSHLKYCSRPCKNKWQSINLCGENSPHYGKKSPKMVEWHRTHTHPQLGKKHTAEALMKMSKVHKGVPKTKEWKEFMSNRLGNGNSPLCGKKVDNETMKLREEWFNKIRGKTYEEIYGIEKAKQMIAQKSMENSPLWRGGCKKPYTGEFSLHFRRLIRQRDNYICMLCNVHSEKLGRALDVHHINDDKNLSTPENCISLCRNCHLKARWNKSEWIKFYHSLLSKRYGYNYSENGDIILKMEEQNVINNSEAI